MINNYKHGGVAHSHLLSMTLPLMMTLKQLKPVDVIVSLAAIMRSGGRRLNRWLHAEAEQYAIS